MQLTAPHFISREHVSTPQSEGGIHTYTFPTSTLSNPQPTTHTHTSQDTHARSPKFSPSASLWGPREPQEGPPHTGGRAREKGGEGAEERRPLQASPALWKVTAPEPKAAGPGSTLILATRCYVTGAGASLGAACPWAWRVDGSPAALAFQLGVLTPCGGRAPTACHAPPCLQLPRRPRWSRRPVLCP